jgi:L-aspartate oxidase
MLEHYLVDLDLRRLPSYGADVVVIGSGVAALRAALSAAESASVLVLTKGGINESNTLYAQGGIAAALSPDDSPALHLEDTLTVGAGLCNREAVARLVEEGPARVLELIQWGMPFDRRPEADPEQDVPSLSDLAFTLEGGHSARRILHAQGDATGRALAATLIRKTLEHPNISVLEHHFAVDFLHAQRTCYGVIALKNTPRQGNGFVKVEAKATILASGGLGQIYRESTNPEVTTGDGMAMALRAGATLQDMEFVQFHPTTLYLAGAKRFLISEAVRGEGAHLLNLRGERFMLRYDERGELAPRDVVSRAIFREMLQTGATHVFLSLKHLDPELVRVRFPSIRRHLEQYHLDITKERIPVRPACHYMMGGVRTDLETRTDVARLYAAGEAACLGVHGANRLASNSLLEGLVFGHLAGLRAAETARDDQPAFPQRKVSALRDKQRFPLDVADVRNSLKSLLQRAAGIVREGESLRHALDMLNFWQCYVYAEEFSDVAGLELQNMLACAQMVVRSALARTESRGAHQREDFPDTDDENWLRHQCITRESIETPAAPAAERG